MENRIKNGTYTKTGAAILCIAALLFSGCYNPIECAGVLLLFGALMFFIKAGVSLPALLCAGGCFAGFLISGLTAGGIYDAPVEIMKYTFLFFPVLISDLDIKKSMVSGIYIGAVLLSLAGAAGLVFDFIPVGAGSLLEYENTMAVFACVGAACAFYFAVADLPRRFLHSLAFLVCLLAMIAANSIFLYFCIAAALAVVLCLRYKRAWYFIAASAFLVVCGAAYLFWSGREGLLLTSTVASRLIYWQDAAALAVRHPFGIGVYGWENAQYACQSAAYSVKYVHNSLLQLALDGGFAAAAGYLAFVIYGAVGAIKRYRRDRKPYWLLILFLIIVLFLHALFDFDQAYGGYLLTLGVCVGVVSDTKAGRGWRYGLIICLIAAIGLCMSYISPQKPDGVTDLTNQWRTAYDTGRYTEAYEISQRLIDEAPRLQASYDAAYLSIDKFDEIGYSDKYNGALEELRTSVDQVNATMNPLVRYLDRHRQIILPAAE